jgi:hypothetical protein
MPTRRPFGLYADDSAATAGAKPYTSHMHACMYARLPRKKRPTKNHATLLHFGDEQPNT